MVDGDPSDPLLDSIEASLRSKGFRNCSVLVILGSGLGGFASRLESPVTVRTKDIPGYPGSTIIGHAGKIHFGRIVRNGLASDPLIVFEGRIHPYEGGVFSDSSLNVRIGSRFNAGTLVVTNAAGGIRSKTPPGTLLSHTDIIRLPIPFRWHHVQKDISSVTRSTSMSYSGKLRAKLHRVSADLGIPLASGTYCYLAGPTYETPAEVGMLDSIGADAVGMSTYPEVAEAASRRMDILGISLISNLAAGLTQGTLDHSHVTEVADKAGSSLGDLLEAFLLKGSG